jgi:murein DD-endopeptidase MepM/ murein hydrolase activator NlpD
MLTPQERRAFFLALAVIGAAGTLFARQVGYLGGLRTAPALVVSSPPTRILRDTLHSRETLSQLFARRGVSDVDWGVVAAAVRNFNPSRIRAGTEFRFTQAHGEEAPRSVAVRVSYDTRLLMTRDTGTGAWAASAEHIMWRTEPFLIDGVVRTSVSEAVTEAIGDDVLPRDARVDLVWTLAEVYDWEVDFSRDVQPGDRFHVLAERMVSTEGEVRYNRILAARLDVGPHPLYAFRFDDADGRQQFYDDAGKSLKREMLRAPLEFKRISSGFSKSRYHPILHYNRPHQGIDFSAAYGAPVRVVGKGTVVFAGRLGGYGNVVEVRHNDHTETRYAHLSGFGPGVREGSHVEQGQTVGFVGASGLATSPHLHYELRINGRAVNPRRQFAAGEGAPIVAARRAAFNDEKRRLLQALEPPQGGARVD